jgi:hypothetical protein
MTCGVAQNAGIVLVLQHTKADQVQLTLTTDGTIARRPLQEIQPPPQLGSPCYKTIRW